jgi:hypothetical protein
MEQPDARNLLETARALLLDSLLPALPAEKRLEARMVASAMAIAARAVGAPHQAPDAALAAAIRAGALDHDPALPGRLREVARARLAVSNPRALG